MVMVMIRAEILKTNKTRIKMKLFQQTKLKTLSIALFALFAIGVGSIVTGDSAFAATKTWIGASAGTFNTSGNWSPSGVPSNGDDLVFTNSTGSGLSVTNNMTGLSIHSITISGANPVSITNSSALTLTGNVISSTGTSSSSSLQGNIVLGADATLTNMYVAGLTGNTVALGGHTLTLASDSNYSGSTLSIGQITGAGIVTINVLNTVTQYLEATNSYSGTTNLVSGTSGTLASSSTGIFGTSTIIVGPTASLALEATGSSWTFSNAITVQAATVGQSGYLEAQVYVFASQAGQVVNIPNITLQGNARFDLNDAGAAGSTVNLAGIVANGHCIQYGTDNNDAAQFLNGPTACVIGTDASAPNTAVAFVKANPFLIIGLGIVTAAFLTLIAVRSRSTK